MFKKQGLLLIVVLLMCQSDVRSQTDVSTNVRMLRNSDVLRMVGDGMKSGDVITTIFTSSCNFDIFPPVLRDLKRRGVPDTVILAMKMAPTGPPAIRSGEAKPTLTAPVRIPAGTLIEVENAKAVSSANVVEGSQISFSVTKRVFVNNILAIERGSLATARVTKVRKASALGRAGMLAWEMESVLAVDGTCIPIVVTGKQSGKNRSVALAGGAAATAAVLFPYTSPVALIWGLKKGEEAVLRGSRVFLATVRSESEIAGIQPRPGGVIYHDQDTVKASAAPPTNTNFSRGSVRAGGGTFRPH